jgi:SAM-dependent methyltransferase
MTSRPDERIEQRPVSAPDAYWRRAGEAGYARTMFVSDCVERHVNDRLWNAAIEIADALGVPYSGRVLDFGCGDGAFANAVLAWRYRAIDGLDKAETAIIRARATAPGPHVTFDVADLTKIDYTSLSHYDGAFFMGILHHVKAAAPDIVRAIVEVADRIVVLEPNGDNLLRKLLEQTPHYRDAGEDSFRTDELIDIFAAAGLHAVVRRRMNLFPNFTPGWLFRTLAPLEPSIEASPFWNALCTVNMLGFRADTGRIAGNA